MAKPHNLIFGDWNEMVPSFHGESDRGAAVLAGGFVENYLAVYLKSFVVDEKVGEELFGALGPLSSFSQRTALARAFGFISEQSYRDLTLIRKIRNHFAHHPLDATFASPEVAKLAGQLTGHENFGAADTRSAEPNRQAYLFACAMVCGTAHLAMGRRTRERRDASVDKS